MTEQEFADWTHCYQEREAIMLESGVINASQKALADTRRHGIGLRPPWAWGGSCARGWVSDARFDPAAPVIKRTNRATTKAWRKLGSS